MKRAAGEFCSYGKPKEWNHFASLDMTLVDINSRSSKYTDNLSLISKKPIVDSGADEENLILERNSDETNAISEAKTA